MLDNPELPAEGLDTSRTESTSTEASAAAVEADQSGDAASIPQPDPTKRIIMSLDEFGAAKRVFKAHGNRFRFITDSQSLVTWDGARYGPFPHLAEGLAKDVMEKIQFDYIDGYFHVTEDGLEVERADVTKFQKKARTLSMIRKALNLVRLAPKVQVKAGAFNENRYEINCLNGLLSLETETIAPHDPNQLVTKLAPVRWNPGAPCDFWRTCIEEIALGDKDLVAYLQRLFGYCLTGSTQEEVMPIFYGTGANGKSLCLGTLRMIMGSGEYAITLGTGSILNSNFHGIRCDLRQLEGARVAFAIEVNHGSTLDEAVVKAITGGDEISARAMRENPVQFTPQVKILMAVNHLPGFVGNDRGIRRRLQVIPFNHQYDGTVPKEVIERKLAAEAEGIFAWAVAGFHEWQKQGLNPPEVVRKATQEYFQKNDHIGMYLAERTVETPNAMTPVRMLFDDYRAWSRDFCVQALGLHQFGELLRSRGIAQDRTSSERVWKGIAIRHII